MKHAQANPTSAATNANIVPAVSGRMIRLQGVYISSDTATSVTLQNSTTHGTLLWKQNVAANGGVVSGFTEGINLGQTLVGEGFDYTTADDADVFILVAYEVV